MPTFSAYDFRPAMFLTTTPSTTIVISIHIHRLGVLFGCHLNPTAAKTSLCLFFCRWLCYDAPLGLSNDRSGHG
jgi:hypothetical protein